MLPAVMVAVSTERIVAMPARVMATSTMSAMIRIVPPCRARGCTERARRENERGPFMSARLPYPVAQGNRGLEHAIPVAFPVIRSGHARTDVESRLVIEGGRPRGTRPLRFAGGERRIARIAELPRG